MTIKIKLPDQRTAFEPGEVITVVAEWTLLSEVRSMELRLVWYTSGKGGTDHQVVQQWPFPNPQQRDSKSVQILLPASPYSFSGKLISLVWALELTAHPSGKSKRTDLVIAPASREVVLRPVT